MLKSVPQSIRAKVKAIAEKRSNDAYQDHLSGIWRSDPQLFMSEDCLPEGITWDEHCAYLEHLDDSDREYLTVVDGGLS